MNSALRQSDDLLLRAWRRGEMDAAAEDAFEARLFFEPDLLASAQADQAMEEGLRLVTKESPELLAQDATTAASSDESAVASAVPQATSASVSRRRPLVAGPWSMLLAAGLGAAAILPFAGQLQTGPQPAGNLEWVSLDVRRGVDSAPLTVAPRASAGVVAMELAAPAGATAPLTLRVIEVGSDTAVMVIPGLEPSDGLISFAFARDQLAAGDYRIEILGSGNRVAEGSDSLLIRYRPSAR